MLYTGVMTKVEIQRQVMELPEEERLAIADAIWASLDSHAFAPVAERPLG
jgi:hypothetical protein